MDQPDEGEIIRIESYKHGGRLHRAWKKSVVMEKGEPLIIANYDVEVVEADGREWVFPGLAIGRFHRSEWFHTIIVYDGEGNHRFYNHIASPYRYRDGVLSYTDYDLDLVAEADLRWRWVDQEEYARNRVRFAYPDHVLNQVEEAVGRLENRIRSREEPFTSEWVRHWYHRFQSFKSRLME